jgi:hypothetical protein
MSRTHVYQNIKWDRFSLRSHTYWYIFHQQGFWVWYKSGKKMVLCPIGMVRIAWDISTISINTQKCQSVQNIHLLMNLQNPHGWDTVLFVSVISTKWQLKRFQKNANNILMNIFITIIYKSFSFRSWVYCPCFHVLYTQQNKGNG